MTFITKEYKFQLVDWYINQLKKLNLSDKTIGFFMRAYHVNLPIYFVLIMLFASQIYNIFLLIFLIFIFLSFFIFEGCILSKVEYKLDNEDITVVDPLLELCRQEVNQQNRMNISIFIAFSYLFSAFFIYYLRFGSFYLKNNIYDDLNVFKGFFIPLDIPLDIPLEKV